MTTRIRKMGPLQSFKHLFLVFIFICLAACATSTTDNTKRQAAYAMPDRYSAAAVNDILRRGGNAVDAAIAAAFVLAVTFPEAGNIGGGGFMLARVKETSYFLDYRETAPQAASRDMYLLDDGSAEQRASLVGIRAAGVPGTVAGMWEAHQKFGSMPWRELLAPAVRLAMDGFAVHPQKAADIPDTIGWFGEGINFADYFAAMTAGGLFRQPELAETLARIALNGEDEFYLGETAERISDYMHANDGLIDMQDLKNYQAVWRDPLTAEWREYQVITAPPPSSGGVALLQLLKMKQHLAAEFDGLEHNSAPYVHLIAEMEKRVFADRAEYLGDPDFVDVPVKKLLDQNYNERRAEEVNRDNISPLKSVQPGLESPQTTHYSIIDYDGNVVSNTYTLNWSYGSGVVVEGTGILLNNEMDDFSTKPGQPNAYGVIGGSANEIRPRKRMLSSMTPTILLKDDEVKFVVGTPGGSTIFTSVFQSIINVVDSGMSAQQAVAASRFHHQLVENDLITMSIRFPLPEKTQNDLRAMGYRVQPHGFEFGDVQVINAHHQELDAASDPRGIGVAGKLGSR